jgi:carboxypeptidase family protein/TonB-dependent receptor-like protein
MNQAQVVYLMNKSSERRRGMRMSIATSTRLLSMLLIGVFCFSSARAQLYTGSVSGLVTDPLGAVITSAEITLEDEEKGFLFKARTDSAGRYHLRQIPPGTYKIRVEAGGFGSQERKKIKLNVNQNLSLDFSMAVGTTAVNVEVSAQPELLAREDAVTGQVVNRKFINDLPLLDRSVLDLAYLAPGVTDVDNNCRGCTANNFISNGSRGATADVLLDGVTVTNYEQNSGVQAPVFVPSVDSVEEFKVAQSNFSAEFGFSGATIVNAVTRSGGNAFHGSVYEYLRNDKLNANEFFANTHGEERQPLRKNNFGFTLGGPFKRNKTFFFVDYQGLRQRTFASTTAGVPTLRQRAGDFGEICTLRGATFDSDGFCTDPAGQLYDPYSGVFDEALNGPRRSRFIPFNNLVIYQSPGSPKLAGTSFQPGPFRGNLIDPVARRLMELFPLPTRQAESLDELLNDNFFAAGTNRGSDNQFNIKIDHRFNDRNQLNAKFARRSGNSHDFNCFGNIADPCTGGPVESTAHLFALNDTHTFSPTLVLSVSYGLTRGFDFRKSISGDFPDLDAVTQLGMPGYMNRSGQKAYPTITINGYSAAGDNNIGTQSFSIIRQGQEVHHFTGNLSWLRGKHDLKFGGEGRVSRINFVQPGWPGGDFNFANAGSSAIPTDLVDEQGNVIEHAGGDAMASFLMGIGDSDAGGLYEVPNFVSTQNFRFGFFIQNNYKAKNNLTLNLGFRYELAQPRTERYNRMNYLDQNLTMPLQVPGLGRSLKGGEVFLDAEHRHNYLTDYKNLQPRIGLAYQAPHGFVVRAGYGIYFSTPRSSASGTGPWGFQGFNQQTPWITTFENDRETPFGRLSDPFPGPGPLLPRGSALGPLNDLGFDAVGPIREISRKTPSEQSWSLGIQKELPLKILAEATYVGKKGTHLYFGSARQLNHLGPEIENMSLDQIHALNEQVDNPFFGIITDQNSPLSGPTVPRFQLMVPFPQFTGFLGDSPPVANSIYHAGQFRMERRFSNGLQFLVTYTISKSIDNASVTDDSVEWLGGALSLQNPNNLALERSVSGFDISQLLQFTYSCELPFGRGKRFGNKWGPILNAVAGGWQTNGIWRFDTGRPILPRFDGGQSLPTYGGQRPNLVGPLRRSSGPESERIEQYFANRDVLQRTPDFTLGNAPRTISSVRQPGTANTNLSLFKNFSLGRLREGMGLQIRLEAFNAFNHTQFAGPDTTIGTDDSFGQIRSTNIGPREMQIALRFSF